MSQIKKNKQEQQTRKSRDGGNSENFGGFGNGQAPYFGCLIKEYKP
jgi:hypothetical protein